MTLESLAIIPARGGSKRIPRKNIRDFLGKPIISYSIDTAIQSNCFARVMVSTDDEEIAEIAKQFGAEVPFLRSSKNSDDHSTVADVVKEVLIEFEQQGQQFEYFCCILPTAPFVNAEIIKRGYKTINETGAISVVPVTAFGYPIQRALKIDASDKRLKMFWPENYNKRSQDLESSYHDAGQFYWMRSKSLLETAKIFTENTYPIVIPELEVQDIDTEADWKLAELKYKLAQEGRKTVESSAK